MQLMSQDNDTVHIKAQLTYVFIEIRLCTGVTYRECLWQFLFAYIVCWHCVTFWNYFLLAWTENLIIQPVKTFTDIYRKHVLNYSYHYQVFLTELSFRMLVEWTLRLKAFIVPVKSHTSWRFLCCWKLAVVSFMFMVGLLCLHLPFMRKNKLNFNTMEINYKDEYFYWTFHSLDK